MLPSGKWIDGIDADGGVGDAARRSLEARLTAVARALPLAAHLAHHDIEHVHRLRVATRRAIAALKLYRDWLPRKPARWLKKRLRKIRRAAGDARDFDVLGARLRRDYGPRAMPAVEIIARQRAAVQSAIVRVAERCRRRDRFVRKTSKLLERIETTHHDGQAPESFRPWAASQLAASANAFFDCLPDDTADTAALHQFRIRAKELRYTMELAVAAFGPEMRSEQYPVVEELQERLGKVQDHVAAMTRLADWAGDAAHAQQQVLLRDLAEEERERLGDAVADFQDWWTSERAAALRTGLLQPAPADSVTASIQAAHQT